MMFQALSIEQNLVRMLQIIEQKYKSEYNQNVNNVIMLPNPTYSKLLMET